MHRGPGRGVALVLTTGTAVFLGSAAAIAVDFIVPTGTNSPPGFDCTDQPESGPTSDPGVCKTDNRLWRWYMDSQGEFELENEDRTEAQGAIEVWDDNTQMERDYHSNPVFEGPGETDLVFQEGVVEAFPVAGGITWCVDRENGTNWVCDSHYVRIRGNGVYEKWLAAHEAGHGLGLTHGQQAMPQKGENDPITGKWGRARCPPTSAMSRRRK